MRATLSEVVLSIQLPGMRADVCEVYGGGQDCLRLRGEMMFPSLAR